MTQECDFIADNYAIEETRRSRTSVSETEETTYDESIFVLELVKYVTNSGDTLSLQSTAIDATNISRPGEFINAKLTPRHMAARWKDYLFQSSNKSALRFTSGEINYKASFNTIPAVEIDLEVSKFSLETFADSTPQQENEDIAYNASRIKAELVSFSYPLTLEEYKTIKANPYGIVRVNGQDGWIKSFKYSFANGLAEFKLIPKA
jgi:hypothetical protein